MYIGLIYMIQQGILSNELLLRYITGHPVSKVTVGMFFVGLASLALIAKNVFEQFGSERKITVQGSDEEADSEDEVTGVSHSTVALERRMLEMPRWMHEHYLWQRIGNTLDFLNRTNSTEGVEDELKYLADLDLDRQQQRYSLVQILIWATPMLGFLGTVLGISQALGGINVGPDNNFQQMMDGLRGSLYVAFDTTALALTLSMILMFGQFLIERFESQLLELVDQRSRIEIAGQFDLSVAEPTDTVDRMAEEVWDASRELVEKQTEVWRKSIQSAERAWVASLTDVNAQVQANLSDALEENVTNLAHYLGESIEKADLAMSHRWEQWQVTLSDNARLMSDHQQQVTEQTKIILQLAERVEIAPSVQPVPVKHPDDSDVVFDQPVPQKKTGRQRPSSPSATPAETVQFADYDAAPPSSDLTSASENRNDAEVILPFQPVVKGASPIRQEDQTRHRSPDRSPNKAA